MTDSPRVSVVIPSYNHERFAAQAIKSVLEQSFQDFEIVVTDDASSDTTPDVIRSFRDPRVHLEVFERNRGACIALNRSITRARGDLLCYLATDDFFLPDKLQKQVAFFDQHPDTVAVFGMPRHVDERGQRLSRGFADFTIPFRNPNPTRIQWLRHFFFKGNCLAAPTAMVRRSGYARVGLFDPRLAGLPDFDMWVKLCMEAEIHVMQEELTAFRILDNAKNMSAPRRDSLLRDMFEFFEILKHYRKMQPDFARQVFAADIAANGINVRTPYPLLLAEIALLGDRPAHKLFALETMFEGSPLDAEDHNRLIRLVGELDPFGVGVRIDESERRKRVHANAGPEGTPMHLSEKVGRNDLCPCGSGKKYKKCHGRNGPD